jgi:hypothetical protein
MFIPDKFARTVRLLVKITDGIVTMADGTPLPKINSDARGELVLFSVYSLVDEKDRAFYAAEHEVSFLPKGTSLWARVNNDPVGKNLEKFRTVRHTKLKEPYNFVQFILDSDLKLIRKPGKNAVLTRCNCTIPAIEGTAGSINEAYTKISTAFEPKRRSHTGNVFQCVFVEDGDKLAPLEDKRMKAENEPIPLIKQEGLFP